MSTPKFNHRANIVLVGFMGSGKSTVGRKLARQLKRRFLDMDKIIEHENGRSISEIFEQEGEAKFRGLESALALQLAVQTNRVISTGGGIVLNPANLEALGATGMVVCLSVRPETVLERVAHNTHRPLLAGSESHEDKLKKIQELYFTRKSLYDAIPIQVATDGRSPEDIVEEILARR